MEHHAESDMAAYPQAKSENDPLAHHVSQPGMQRDGKGDDEVPNGGALGSWSLGRFDFRCRDEARQIIRHKIQRFFTAVGATAFFPSLNRKFVVEVRFDLREDPLE
jgi:hypothetical protein